MVSELAQLRSRRDIAHARPPVASGGGIGSRGRSAASVPGDKGTVGHIRTAHPDFLIVKVHYILHSL